MAIIFSQSQLGSGWPLKPARNVDKWVQICNDHDFAKHVTLSTFTSLIIDR